MEKIVKKIISCKVLYYILAMILFVATYYLDLKAKLEQNSIEGNHLKYFIIASIISGIIIFLLIVFSKFMYKKIRQHIVYLILALIVGSMYILFIPLCAQSDEPAHMYRAFQVAKGEVIAPFTDGEPLTDLPKSLNDMIYVNSTDKKREYKKYYDIKEMSKIQLNEEETTKVATVANYHGISYLPQVIGIKIGIILKLNPYYIAMLGRITGFILIILMFSFGIYKLPKHKLFASIVLLSPVVLSYAAGISADGMTLASIFLLISYVLYFKETKNNIKIYEYFILALLVFVVAISKIAYLPVIGILAFIPNDCYKNNKKFKWIVSSIILLFGICTAIWWMKTCNVNVEYSENVDSNTWIYTNPLGYLIVLFRTTIYSWNMYLTDMFAGIFLCHKQVNPYDVVPFCYIIIAILSFMHDENSEKTTTWQKIATTCIIIISYVLISTAMYVYNTAYRNEIIIGVQGRYLVPLLMLAVFFGNKKRIEVQENRLVNIALIANYAVYLAMMTTFFA